METGGFNLSPTANLSLVALAHPKCSYKLAFITSLHYCTKTAQSHLTRDATLIFYHAKLPHVSTSLFEDSNDKEASSDLRPPPPTAQP